jgi:LPXTG-motif cell wall-anchored protein
MAVVGDRERAELTIGRITVTDFERTATKRGSSRLRRLALIAPLAVAGTALVGSSVSAGPGGDKVFVCKYVGTPGEDERLQTGQNPISVSVNAIPAGAQVGAFFADQQGRSFVLAFDTGQPEPPVSECPPPDGPTTTTTGGPTTTGGGGPTTTLPNTGADNASLIGAAVVFVLGGGIAMAAARRRTA